MRPRTSRSWPTSCAPRAGSRAAAGAARMPRGRSGEELAALVRRAAGRALAERGLASGPRPLGVHVDVRPPSVPDRPEEPEVPPDGGRKGGLLTARDLAAVPDGGALSVEPGTRVTPLAREEAFRRGIRLGAGAVRAADGCPRAGEPLRVAVGADHAGFALKRDVLVWLRELGHRPLDLGTHDEN